MKLVTLYIPTHNRVTMLKEALASALKQDYSAIEIIVIDDGSEDETPALLSEYADLYGIRFYRFDSAKGACSARNKAIKMAKGELITGLDDDDLLRPDHISKLVKHFSSQYAFVCASILEDKGSKQIIRSLDCGELTLDDMLFYNKAGNQVLTLTSRLREIGGFDESLPAFQDYELWIRLIAKYGYGFKYNYPSYILRTAHEKQRISSSSEKRLKALDLFISKHQNKMNQKHHKSIKFLYFHIRQSGLTLKEACSIVSSKNYKRVTMLYIKNNFPTLKKLIDGIRCI